MCPINVEIANLPVYHAHLGIENTSDFAVALSEVVDRC
jgi:hypothetical protein